MNKILFFIASLIIGFALAFSFADYSYAESSIDEILFEMCIQKQKHGLTDNCNAIKHNITSPNITISSDIGVILSNSCLTMINHNITTNCPEYDLLQNTYPDVIVDPDSKILSKIRLITISTNVPEYKLKPESTKMTLKDNSFDYSFGKLRHVDDSCKNAIISPNLLLLNDTIQYMKNDCDIQYTNVNTISKYQKSPTTINLNDYKHYKYKAWLEDTISNCTKQYGLCK